MNKLLIKRVYDAPEPGDGARVLVDRLWPRGLSKQQALIDHWLKDIAPSSELRKWYGHDDSQWDEFKIRYFNELSALNEPVTALHELMKGKTITLLYGAHSETHNNAVALAEFILGR